MRQAKTLAAIALLPLLFAARLAHADDAPVVAAGGPEAAPVTEAPAPAHDWALLHAGIRPRLATFGGIATLAVAQGRVHHFYGVASFATVRQDAGVFVGATELALGQANAEKFYGVAQLGLSKNLASGSFTGVAQLSLAHNDAETFGGVLQLAPYDRAGDFYGVAQIGGYDHTERDFGGALQLGLANAEADRFRGLTQILARPRRDARVRRGPAARAVRPHQGLRGPRPGGRLLARRRAVRGRAAAGPPEPGRHRDGLLE